MTRKKYTERDLQEHLQVVADLAEEIGRTNIAEYIRTISVTSDRDSPVEIARGILYRDYYTAIQSAAKAIVDETHGRDAIQERIHEDADGWVTYTHDGLHAFFSSENWEAIFDAQGEVTVNDVSSFVAQAGYYAVERDLQEAVQRILDERGEEEE